MSSIPADATSYYAAYGLGGVERRDSAGPTLPNPAAGPTLSAHNFFQQHQQAQQQHQQQPQLHTAVSQYHSQQQQQQRQQQASHQSPPVHSTVPQYHVHQQHAHFASLPPTVHHVPTVVDVAHPYQSSDFASYSHSAYHGPQSVDSHSVAFGPGGNAHVDSAALITASSALHVSNSPAHLHQQGQHPQQKPHPHMVGDNMRFECILEAPTAAAQKAEESPLTYLNKGQLYGISLLDKTQADMLYCSTLRIAFHEDSHRKGAATYWNFWLNQQESPRLARAMELDKAGSVGVLSAETKQFDRVTFQWQGRRGAKVMIRFNCLSTDFSRIKGVKGIPLRIHLDTHYTVSNSTSGAGGVSDFAVPINQLSLPLSPFSTSGVVTSPQSAPAAMRANAAEAPSDALSSSVSPSSGVYAPNPLDTPQQHGESNTFPNTMDAAAATAAAQAAAHAQSMTGMQGGSLGLGKVIERSYARIKLFRDKGAERKNKDDQRHLDKTWEKQKAKLALKGTSSAPSQQQLAEFTMSYAPILQVTPFLEYTLAGDDCDSEELITLDDLWTATSSMSNVATAALEASGSGMSPSIAGLSSMSIGMSGIQLGNLGSPLSPTAASSFIRKRSIEDDSELL
ncbi:hypothetical protein EV174_003591, partial [Coemansia sp. RSA 2320]